MFRTRSNEEARALTLWHLIYANLPNWSSAKTFFLGPIDKDIYHVRAVCPFGYSSFTKANADKFTAAALSANGKASYWAGVFETRYFANNDARLDVQNGLQESHDGIIDEETWERLRVLTGGNNVMLNFPAFQPINSSVYRKQRAFLLNYYHRGAEKRLPDIVKATVTFLSHYSKESQGRPLPLREFISLLVLRNSSHLLGLTDLTLDALYLEQPEFRHAINRVAKYVISERADPALEEVLYQLFLRILEGNFKNISKATPKTNLIRNIFDSMNVEFPENFADFKKLPEARTIAMTFVATGIGAMVHSTVNSLDWAMARLLNDPKKLAEFEQIIKRNKNVDLTKKRNLEKDGPFRDICAWILHNIFLRPTFSHQVFFDGTSEGNSIKFKLFNYQACNESHPEMISADTFFDQLARRNTTERFVKSKKHASFGGCATHKGSKSRVCPAATVSALEQMAGMVITLGRYSLQLTDSNKLSCEVDPARHPMCSRVDSGDVILIPKWVADAKLQPHGAISLIKHKKTSLKNLNGFFNQLNAEAKTKANTQKVKQLLKTGALTGATAALYTLTRF